MKLLRIKFRLARRSFKRFIRRQNPIQQFSYSDRNTGLLINNVKGINVKNYNSFKVKDGKNGINSGVKTTLPDLPRNIYDGGFTPEFKNHMRNRFWTNKNDLLLKSIIDHREMNGYA